jgi:arylsulfatase A-like enzyme
MRLTPALHRVIVLVLDGLRPDALDAFSLPHLQRLRHRAAATLSATTVAPSVTWAAMTSLLTGVHPAVHGIVRDQPHIPRPRAILTPLAQVIADAGLATSAFMADVPFVYRGLATRIARRLGFGAARFAGRNAAEIVFIARQTLQAQRHGLILLHWPDADRAGHEHGWMSPEYGIAARGLDAATGLLSAVTQVERDPHSLLLICADHGGGGDKANDHASAHPLDRTVPVLAIGGRVCAGEIEGAVNLLDLPPTVLWALGLPIPGSYTGQALRMLVEQPECEPAVA